MSLSLSARNPRRLLTVAFALVALISASFVAAIAAQDDTGALAPSGPASLDRASMSHDPSAPPVEYGPSAPGVVRGDFSESFEDVSTLPGDGWAMQNNSLPPGTTGWFQGNEPVFPAHQGSPTSYVAANYQNTDDGTISNWLLTPEITLYNAAEFSFWTRTPAGSPLPDRLQVRLSSSGSSTHVGTGAEDVGDFDRLLLDINEDLAVGGFPEVWTRYTIIIDGLAGPTQGRLAFRYYVGPGNNANYIGIDTLEYNEGGPDPTPTPTPTTTPTVTPVPGACSWGEWEPVAPINQARARAGLVYLASTGKFYLVGGSGGYPVGGDIPIEEYDPATNTWTERAFLQPGTWDAGAAAVGEYIYVPGGGDTALDTMQRFDPVANIVTQMAPLPAPNRRHAVASLDNKIYVLGGSETVSEGTTNYIYDVATDTWSTGAPLPIAVEFTAATSDGQYIYIVGGNTNNVHFVQIYDPASDTYLPHMLLNHGRGGPGAFYDGENVWAVSGYWWYPDHTATTEYWNGTGWFYGPEVNVPARLSSVAFGDGIALKAAGDVGSTYIDDAEILTFDCAVGPTQTPTPATSSIQLSTLEINRRDSNVWPLISLVGVAGLIGAAWVGGRGRR